MPIHDPSTISRLITEAAEAVWGLLRAIVSAVRTALKEMK